MSVDVNKTIYVYEKDSGRIQYTIDNAGPEHIRSFNDKGINFYVGNKGSRITGTFVREIQPQASQLVYLPLST